MSSAALSSLSSASARAQEPNRDVMYDTFQTWALQNYGDSGKTKTVTRRKYTRIVHILSGEESPTAENSKFRFWVKAKGFRLGPMSSQGISFSTDDKVLYVPSRIQNDPLCSDGERDYKKVAIVEDFFDIIYSVHVEMDGRGGKHAGQKRTYRAIAETYSFLPREAVTRFLMSCADCQKRMHLSFEHNNNTACATNQNGNNTISPSHVTEDPPIIDFSLPITQTYLNHMRNKGYVSDYSCHDERGGGMGRDWEEGMTGGMIREKWFGWIWRGVVRSGEGSDGEKGEGPPRREGASVGIRGECLAGRGGMGENGLGGSGGEFAGLGIGERGGAGRGRRNGEKRERWISRGVVRGRDWKVI